MQIMKLHSSVSALFPLKRPSHFVGPSPCAGDAHFSGGTPTPTYDPPGIILYKIMKIREKRPKVGFLWKGDLARWAKN